MSTGTSTQDPAVEESVRASSVAAARTASSMSEPDDRPAAIEVRKFAASMTFRSS